MTDTVSKRIQHALARMASTILQPLLMPLYAMLIMLNGSSYMVLLFPPQVKMFLILTVIVCTLVIPALFIFFLNAMGALEDLKMNNRRERVVPLIVIMLTYALCALIIVLKVSTGLAFSGMMAAIACIAVALVVTPFWKISLHMTGIGGVYAILLFLGIHEPGDFTIPMTVATLLAGVLAWSRLYLGRHTPAQVLAGFFGGFLAASLVLFIL